MHEQKIESPLREQASLNWNVILNIIYLLLSKLVFYLIFPSMEVSLPLSAEEEQDEAAANI